MTLISPNHLQNVLSPNIIPYIQPTDEWGVVEVKFKP